MLDRFTRVPELRAFCKEKRPCRHDDTTTSKGLFWIQIRHFAGLEVFGVNREHAFDRAAGLRLRAASTGHFGVDSGHLGILLRLSFARRYTKPRGSVWFQFA
jgi:hypothetical protein